MALPDHYQHALRVLEYDRIREVLTSYAASALGRKVAARIEPLADPARLRALHAETTELCELMRVARLPLSGLSEAAEGIRAIREQGRPAEPDFLYRVVELIRAGQSLRAVLSRDPDLYPHLARLAAGLEDLPDLREEIPRSIEPSGDVRDEATVKLAGLRKEIRELRETLRHRSASILRQGHLRKCFQEGGVTVKDDRYLLPVKAEYRSWIHGPIRDRSQSGATLFIEPEQIVSDGDALIDKVEDEKAEVSLILWALTRKLLDRRQEIERLERRLARIDFTYAKASFATAFELEAPRIDDEGSLELRNARHPYLLWLSRDSHRGLRDVDLEAVEARVVPLDLRMGRGVRILIVTGPNTGGKTVALKTVGLNVLLALSGVPIAAERGSCVPLFQDVFADIGDEQSIEQSLSTFSSHLRQVAEVLRSATDRSLILLDELGSGTDPLEGAALGTALLDAFRERGWNAIITTHLGSLKQYAYIHEGVENAAMEFDPQSLRPTYRLLMGVPGSSNALAVARRLGIDGEIIDRAEQEISKVEAPTREIISRMEISRRRVEKERRRAERVRRRVQKEAREYEERVEEVKARKEVLDVEAELEVDRRMRAAQEELVPLVEKLKNVPQIHRPLVDDLEERVHRLLVATPLGQKREAFARSLHKGDEVYVPK
ncbi:MAG: hypothetical protein JXA90_13400, partial [Planctomycetes bacterium]|nr:hypothetical protein [Planctomycetota bacterium]